MAVEEMRDILIEGFDPSKLKKSKKVDEGLRWRDIQSAYQNDLVLNDVLVGIENIRIGSSKKTELCGVIRRAGIKGIIPLKESGIDIEDANALNQFRALTGKKVAYKVLNFDKEAGIFVASRKQAKEQMAEITLRKIDEGYNIYCVIREVEPGHVVGDIGGIDVHIPVFELTYGWVEDLRDRYEPGEVIEVQVMKIDKEKQEVKVSAKPLMENPFLECIERYKKNGEYVGTVSGVEEYGIFVNLEEGVDSLARHLKFQNVQKGDQVLVRILSLDAEKERISARIIRVLS
ncbi:30S ribosomal protein S1 [Niallia oryzisoli]|uniref:30S ribosomal protein S1 n=1 Tax=Niallia oryzisoli TaxID=1737571 RepID=UPI003736744B